jgi:integrase
MRYTFEDEPIGAELVKAFIIQHIEGVPLEIDERLVEQGYKQSIGVHKMTTVKRRVASLSVQLQMQKLPNPCQDPEVRKLIEKLTKKYGENKNKSRAITLDILNDMLATCEDTLIGARDRALLLFAWASGGRRRSEVADADLKDLEMKGDGNYLYHMPKSKTDQEGRGKTVPVNGIAAGTLRRWIEISGVTLGKIFRSVSKSGNKVGDKITDVDINRIVKRRCEKAGYDPKLYTAHSLRSGFITEAGQRGCPLGDAMELSGHRSVNTAMGYYQVGNLKNNKAANLV